MGTTPVFQSKHNSIIILVLLTFYTPYIAIGVSKMLCFYFFTYVSYFYHSFYYLGRWVFGPFATEYKSHHSCIISIQNML